MKNKTCKGINKAKHIEGCGKETFKRTSGLCSACYYHFLTTDEIGKIIYYKSFLPKVSLKLKSFNQKQTKEQKEKLKTLSQLEAEAKTVFQKWIRKRDEGLNCISCGVSNPKGWDGGHMKKAEIYSGVIFDERNVHKQCSKCNRFLGGNELNYRNGLVERYGLDYVNELEKKANETRNYKYTREELKEIKQTYLKRLKEL
jgi:hypothetical protein